MKKANNFIYRKTKHNKIPRNTQDPQDDRLKETETQDDWLQAIGELFYGKRLGYKTNKWSWLY